MFFLVELPSSNSKSFNFESPSGILERDEKSFKTVMKPDDRYHIFVQGVRG